MYNILKNRIYKIQIYGYFFVGRKEFFIIYYFLKRVSLFRNVNLCKAIDHE